MEKQLKKSPWRGDDCKSPAGTHSPTSDRNEDKTSLFPGGKLQKRSCMEVWDAVETHPGWGHDRAGDAVKQEAMRAQGFRLKK